MTTANENRKTFSISKEYEEVKTILTKVPNYSRFICEAVIEKYQAQSSQSKTDDIQAVLTTLLAKNLLTNFSPTQLLMMALQTNPQAIPTTPVSNITENVSKEESTVTPLNSTPEVKQSPPVPASSVEKKESFKSKQLQESPETTSSQAEETTVVEAEKSAPPPLTEEEIEKREAQKRLRQKFRNW